MNMHELAAAIAEALQPLPLAEDGGDFEYTADLTPVDAASVFASIAVGFMYPQNRCQTLAMYNRELMAQVGGMERLNSLLDSSRPFGF